MTSALYSLVYARVVAAIQTAAYLEDVRILPSTRFEDDLGLDSMDVTEIIFHIEEVFGTEFGPEAISGFFCVADVADHLSHHFFLDAEEASHDGIDDLDLLDDNAELISQAA